MYSLRSIFPLPALSKEIAQERDETVLVLYAVIRLDVTFPPLPPPLTYSFLLPLFLLSFTNLAFIIPGR